MKQYVKEIVSFILLVGGIGMTWGNATWFGEGHVRAMWYAVAFLPVGLPVLREAVGCLWKQEYFNEFMLMSVAALGAFYIGEYPEGVAVMLFYSVGEKFQDAAVERARSRVKALLDVRSEVAAVIRGGSVVAEVPANVQVGETVEVKAGERVPLDGVMLGETAAFNTSALTGESLPRDIRQGESVLAGMIAMDRVVRVRVTQPYERSELARVLEMVQNATERKAPTELFIRRFARVYTPVVTGLAVLIVLLPFIYSLAQPGFAYVFDDWLYRALVFLVISCPCALVVSIPLGYFGGIGAASRHGILFKGGNYLDAITRVNTVVFDKTGTLTRGEFEVREAHAGNGFEADTMLAIVAAAEGNSTHPVAKAVVRYVRLRGIEPLAVTDAKELPGHGLSVRVDGREVLVGNTRLLDANGVTYPAGLASVPETVVVCAVDGVYAGYLLLADAPKEDAADAVAALKSLNINNIEVLSGDKQAIVTKLAKSLGIDKAYGDLLPADKVARLEELKAEPGRKVAFAGDGINDAPVLALADVGIAMGELGSDAAIEIADVVIQTDQPSKIATAVKIGKVTRRVVWQNIALAFGVKLVVLVLGAFGVATMWEAVFADVGVALLAILNAIRIQVK